MRLRFAGFVLTSLAVFILLGSMIAGLGGPPMDRIDPVPVSSVAGDPSRIKVEVLNAAGVSGLAREVTERLRDHGFDVVYYGNAPARLARDSTTVLDRRGNAAAVASVARALGVHRIETALDTTLYVEATVVLAPDFTVR